MSERSLNNPPLDELVFGIQFNGRVFSTNEIIELYQKYFQRDYPEILEKPLIPNSVELVDRTEVRLLQSTESRKQFIHKNDDLVIQLQPDRILFNWRRGKNKSEYPHFDEIFEMFEKEILKNPVIEQKLPFADQLELTYLDRIIDDSFKLNEYQLGSVFNWFDSEKLSRSFQFNQSYYISELHSGVSISISTAIRNSDKQPLVSFETTIRGIRKDLSLVAWYFKAREEVIQIFFDAIKIELIDKWRKRQN